MRAQSIQEGRFMGPGDNEEYENSGEAFEADIDRLYGEDEAEKNEEDKAKE
jgi:hypothetical protein